MSVNAFFLKMAHRNYLWTRWSHEPSASRAFL